MTPRNAPRRLYVHIGTHKTGTTSIQRFLLDQAALLSLDDIYVPRTGLVEFGHHGVAWELRKAVRGDHVKQLLEELGDTRHSRMVISSEDFEYLQHYPIELHIFAETIRAQNIQPIFVVSFRNRADYLQSLVAELKKHGEHHEMGWYEKQLAETDAIRIKGDWYFDFNRVRFVETWKQITKAEMIVMDYDKSVAGLGVVPSFLKVIGASDAVVSAGRHALYMNKRSVRAA
jgi:hypothetical protein